MRDYIPAIPKEQLIDGAYYRGHCRNASIARWDERTQKFYHWRTKFGSTFIETIRCPEDDAVGDVFVTQELVRDMEGIKEIPLPLKEG